MDELGENLVINGDYLANGIRERASDLATLELSLVTEIGQDRFIDLRNEPADPSRQRDLTLRLRRLSKLEKVGLATEHAPGIWELSERMEPALRELGERGDIIRNMHKALKADGLDRDPTTFQLHDAAPEVPIVGRVVEIGPTETASRPSDRAIATIAEGGVYRPSRHLEQAKFEGRVPGADYDGYVDAHVRRLEALRRAGIAERIDADQWRIPGDFESRAAAYDTGRNKQANIRVLSAARLEQQIGADGATWLDRRLMSVETSDRAPTGFGQQMRDAIDRRREHHIDHGDATPGANGGTLYRRNLLTTPRAREIERIDEEMAATKNLPFRAASDGEKVSGKFCPAIERQGRRGHPFRVDRCRGNWSGSGDWGYSCSVPVHNRYVKAIDKSGCQIMVCAFNN